MSSKQKGKKKEEEENVKVVLQIDMHCDCKNCFERISKCTQELHGIKSMNIEETEMKFQVTVTGKVEPLKLQQKFQKKLKKPVELISPKPNEEKEISKKIIMLEINMGCDKCVENMQKIITKTKGFQGIFIDRSKNLVTVDGDMDIDCLVKELKEKLKKSVKIVQKEKKEDNVVEPIWCPNFRGYYGPQYCDCFVLECDFKPIWCPKIHGYGPDYCDRFVYREAEYCRIM